jgi:DNA-directed DNA polymerase III PolC
MDQFEFELRYLSYQGLSDRLQLARSRDTLLTLVKTSWRGALSKLLTEITPNELKELTLETYTPEKQQFIDQYITRSFGTFTVADYMTRLEYELKVVKEMGYNTYFLIVQDFINRAKTHEIAVGPGRGSAAWSLMAWCVRITDVDPFPYGLLFERFLNPARISMPDIDVDFEDEKRYDVIRYVRQKYGEERFAHIGTFGTLAAKAAFKDVARTMGMPFDRANSITELISEKTIKDSMKAREELQLVYDTDDLVKKSLDAAIKLEGNIRQTGVHACGMIIAPEDVRTYTSVQYPPNNTTENQAVVSQFDYHALEDLGLLKMDFLWLRTLSLIKNTIKIVKARMILAGQKLPQVLQSYFDTMTLDIPLDDPLPYLEVFQKGDTSGIFQFEWSGIRAFLVQLKASNIDDVSAMSALYRPGPLEFIPNYIKRKHGEEPVIYMSAELAQTLVITYGQQTMEDEKRKLEEDLGPILGNTYAIAVYQEQLMFLTQSMAWFSLAEADMLRRGIGKKIKAEIERIKGIFVTKSAEFRDYKPETSTYIYEKLIEPAASYSFNKSHAVAYALISYQTAWLKAHYPLEFNAALLRSEEENPEKLSQFISELQIQGYRVLPPHINESFTHVSAIESAIRLGFLSIKGVWYDVSEKIEKERRANGPYASLEDFLTRNSGIITKKTVESLAKAWAFQGMVDRKTILDNLQPILDWTKSGGADTNAWLFWGMLKPSLQLTKSPETSKMEKLLMEYDVFKTFVSGHPFDGLYQYCKKRFTLISAIKQTEQAGDIKILCFVKGIQRAKKKWFFVKVEDLSDEIEFFVKDFFDRQKFDILILEWYKSKSIRLSKVTRTSLEHLIAEATKAGKYDATETIADVKAKRLGKDFLLQQAIAQDVVLDQVAEGDDDDREWPWFELPDEVWEELLAEQAQYYDDVIELGVNDGYEPEPAWDILASISTLPEALLERIIGEEEQAYVDENNTLIIREDDPREEDEYDKEKNEIPEAPVKIKAPGMLEGVEIGQHNRKTEKELIDPLSRMEQTEKSINIDTPQLTTSEILMNEPNSTQKLTLPSSPQTLQQLIRLIKEHPGEILLSIGEKKIYVNQTGATLILELLQ